MNTELLPTKNSKKARCKQKRAYYRLLRDLNVKCCDDPTRNIVICNAGLVTGLQIKDIECILEPFTPNYKVIMIPGKSYSFIELSCKDDAINIYNNCHGQKCLNGSKTPLYLSYCESVPDIDNTYNVGMPPGCSIIADLVTKDEEEMLIKSLKWDEEETARSNLKYRRVKHFGYAFQYGTNDVDLSKPVQPIPKEYEFLQRLFEKYDCGNYKYDQLTVNYYLPGQGIPPHIDTHSPFKDTILSLSLGSPCVMDFKKDTKKLNLYLPPRSLLIMKGEGRYVWSHGICPRYSDIVPAETGLAPQKRGTRISFTFRKVNSGPCECNFPEFCDTRLQRNQQLSVLNDENAACLEDTYVHKVYEEISTHFDETRHQPWANVVKFLETLEKGSLILDVGCGNGKYLAEEQTFFKIGCDRSANLTKICSEKGFQVVLSDCLYLPFKSESVDAIISIAVIHHISTWRRRKQAVAELIRVLRPNGRCLIYVWAKEQKWKSTQSSYLKYNTKKKSEMEVKKIIKDNLILPIHENRTEFLHDDLLVPWKRKGGGKFLRFYHVFEEGELLKLCKEIDSIEVKDLYYEQGNWCIILQKTSTFS